MSTLDQESFLVGGKNLEQYFTNSIVPQLYVDSEMVLGNFTSSAGELFSISHADIGKNICNLKSRIGYNALIENIRGVLITERNSQSEIQTSSGGLFKLNIQPWFNQPDEQLEGVIITLLDLSGQASAMKELEKLNAEHENLLFALSHEVKQPLSIIILLKDALAGAYENQDKILFYKWISDLKRSSSKIKILLDQINEPELLTESATVPREKVNIREIFHDVYRMLREEIQGKKVSIDVDFRIREMEFPKKNMRSIIYNLLGNAIKYKNPATNLEISLSTKRENNYVIFNVQNNGIGISKKKPKKYFFEIRKIP